MNRHLLQLRLLSSSAGRLRSTRAAAGSSRLYSTAEGSSESPSSSSSSQDDFVSDTISALPFRLSSEEAIDAARTCAATAAHWDERGTLENFGWFMILQRLGLQNSWINPLRSFEDDLVTLEQSAAVYIPTWIIDGSISFTASSASDTSQTAKGTLVFTNTRFPGSTWAPVSSLPLWPSEDNVPVFNPNGDTPFTPSTDQPLWEAWAPAQHTSAGARTDSQQAYKPVGIDGPITALPFQLSPLALPDFLKKQAAAAASSAADHTTLSTRQPPTSVEMAVIITPSGHELRTIAEIDQIDGIKLQRRKFGAADEGWFSFVTGFIRSLMNQGRPGSAPSEENKAQNLYKKQKKEAAKVEERRERRIRIQPESLEVDMLAAYPVMLPMHIIKFSYQPNPQPPAPSAPPRKTLTVAVAGWDSTAQSVVRTLPDVCTWSRWGAALDGRIGFKSDSAKEVPEPVNALLYSPLQVKSLEFIPSPPVSVPDSVEGLEEGLENQVAKDLMESWGPANRMFKDPGSQLGAGLVDGAKAYADQIYALTEASSPAPESSGSRTEEEQAQVVDEKRQTVFEQVLRQTYQGFVTQMFQNSLVRKASRWLNAAEADSASGNEAGWNAYGAHQAGFLSSQRASSAESSPASTDPASPDPQLLRGPQVQSINQAMINRAYLDGVSTRGKAEAMLEVAKNGLWVGVLAKEGGPEQGSGASSSSSGPVAPPPGAVNLKMAQGAEAVQYTEQQLKQVQQFVEGVKPEWLRSLHEAQQAQKAEKQ
ncbi:hypothetical protein OC861_002061 [Tilletia horrida]|nr:hypothetical protein OC861_002061 [Tilletia horrida]